MNYFNVALISFISLTLTACSENKSPQKLHFATSAEYPPFEYLEHGEIKGFDIDVAKLIAKELGKEAVFDNMQFSSVLPALTFGQADMAISTITITQERKKNIDFSNPYYFESMAAIFKKEAPVKSTADLAHKKLACQLGTTMEFWAKKYLPAAELTSMNNNNQAIEALKAGHVEVVIMDGAQGLIFSQKNPGLKFVLIAQSDDGYGIALPKNSPLTPQVNTALKKLKASGAIQKLKQQWLEDFQWKN